MKKMTPFIAGSFALALTLLTAPMAGHAAETAPQKEVKPYPLDTCIVSGEKLGEMGKPHVIQHNGQEIKFCCKDCVKEFNKDPDKYLKKLAEDQHQQDSHSDHKHH